MKSDTLNHQEDRIHSLKKTSLANDEQILKGLNNILPPQYQVAMKTSNDKLSAIIINHRLHYLRNLANMSAINGFDGIVTGNSPEVKQVQQYHITGRQIPVRIPQIEAKVARIYNDSAAKADMNLTSPDTSKNKTSP